MFLKVPNVVLNGNGNNHNNSILFVPQKLYQWCRQTYIEIAKLIELSGWAKRKVAFDESLFSEQLLTCLRRN